MVIKSKEVKIGLTESIQNLTEVMNRSLEDARKFDAGNNAAGKRVRTALKDIPKKLKVIKAISLGKEV